MARIVIAACAFVMVVLVLSSRAAAQCSLFVISGEQYQYGPFGRGAPIDGGAFGPVLDTYQRTFAFPDNTATIIKTTEVDADVQGNDRLRVNDFNLDCLVQSPLTGGVTTGAEIVLFIDVYVKGPPRTGYRVTKQVGGTITATHGGGLGTTQIIGDAWTRTVDNTAGTQELIVGRDVVTTGITSTQRHPTEEGYYFATRVPLSAAGFTQQLPNFCFPFPCPQLLTYRAQAVLDMTVIAEWLCPADAQAGFWNTESTVYFNNCYNYATNTPNFLYAQTGWGGTPVRDVPTFDITCANVSAAARADGLTGPFLNIESCGAGTCVVALVVSPGADYHWYRLNADGTWSDKIGWAPAKLFDPGVPLDFTTGTGYTEFCGFFCVPCSARIRTDPARYAVIFNEFGVRGGVNVKSGEPNPTFPIDDAQTLQALANAITAAPPIPPPSDTLVALGFNGFTIQSDGSVPGIPGFARFVDDVIMIFTPSGIEYRQDVAGTGAGAIMRQQAIAAGLGGLFGACPADLDNDGNVANGLSRDGAVDINDLLCFLGGFEAGNVLVDLDNDGDPSIGSPDNAVDINDLLFFLARFEAGC